MDRVQDIVEMVILLLVVAVQNFGYWLDGVKIDFYASDEYRQEAVALMDADSAFMNAYRSETWSLFEQRDFAGLTAAIAKSQAATEAGAIPLQVWRDMDVFYGDDLDKEKVLNDWVQSDPDNWIPYAARAEFLVAEGWRARGDNYSIDTTEKQFAGMREAFTAAEKDLVKTLALKPAFTGTYDNYLELARHGEGGLTEAQIIALAAEQGVSDYYLRYQYIQTLQPKWGGSFEEIRHYALESQHDREADPRIYQLLGYEYQIRGELASHEQEWQACVEYYTKAFEYGDLYTWRYGRAKCNENLQRWDAFIADLQVVGASSRDHMAFSRVAHAYANKKRYRQALASIEKAIALEPDVVAHHNYAGWLQMTMKQDDKALAAFARSLSILPNDVYAADNTARIHLSRQEREAALPYLEISAHYDETNAQKWYLYADVLNHLEKPEYRTALTRFLQHVDRNDARWADRIKMVEAHLAGRGNFE
jgi:tetratricopeptide (TPR) repeat protein